MKPRLPLTLNKTGGPCHRTYAKCRWFADTVLQPSPPSQAQAEGGLVLKERRAVLAICATGSRETDVCSSRLTFHAWHGFTTTASQLVCGTYSNGTASEVFTPDAR